MNPSRFDLKSFAAVAIVAAAAVLAPRTSSADEDEVVLPPDVVRIEPSEAQPLELVSQKVSRDGKELTIVLKAEKGSFYLGLNFTGTHYKTATIIVKDAWKWESIEFFASKQAKGMSVDLLHLKGVSIVRTDGDCIMTFNPSGYKILPPGGSLRYIALPKEDK